MVHQEYENKISKYLIINPSNAELNLTCHLLALFGAHHILHIIRIRVKLIRYKRWEQKIVSNFNPTMACKCDES